MFFNIGVKSETYGRKKVERNKFHHEEPHHLQPSSDSKRRRTQYLSCGEEADSCTGLWWEPGGNDANWAPSVRCLDNIKMNTR